ncbi:hypothetical protein AVEN_102864-1 [Araneus ventricosus]|uniref:Uncharacterized protein n=1 Tax=Araneus ventricosus TaxID=182803 RepID=A0A4Y2LAG4_ARAVE|nr:hypothetical protein AVEN_102864-1 [Araneus ventricosus]
MGWPLRFSILMDEHTKGILLINQIPSRTEFPESCPPLASDFCLNDDKITCGELWADPPLRGAQGYNPKLACSSLADPPPYPESPVPQLLSWYDLYQTTKNPFHTAVTPNV